MTQPSAEHPPRFRGQPPHRILLIQLRQLGDILLTTPCLKAVKAVYPEAEVSFLAHPMAKPLLSGNPYCDHLYTYDPEGGIGEFWQLAKTMRAQRFDLVADFMHNPRSAILSLASGGRLRATMSGRRNLLYHHHYQPPKEYIVREKLGLLRSLGMGNSSDGAFDELPLFPWSHTDMAPTVKLVEQGQRETSGPRVILSATHRRPHRRWPKSHYIELASYLYRAWNADIIWVWGPGEQEFVEDLRKDTPVPTRISPKTSLKELGALMANSHFFVGNSNGPSHIAVSQDTPSFQIHGHTQLVSWCPLTSRHRGIEPADKNAPAQQLIEAIPVAKVLTEVEKMRDTVQAHQKQMPQLITRWRG